MGISINGGDVATNTPNVKIDQTWPAFAVSVSLANDGGLRGASSQALAASLPWKLQSSGPERLPKTVYARFEGGRALPVNYTDDIILDQRPPAVIAATLELAGAGPNEARPTGSEMARTRIPRSLRVVARDDNSGIAAVQLSASKSARPFLTRTFGTSRKKGAVRFRTHIKVVNGLSRALIRVRDKAGNWSTWKRAY